MNSELQNPTAFMVDGPIAHTRASDTARQFILSRIFTGELGPGDRLPNERELSAQLGISRLTLREALKSLETAGYLVTKVGAQGGTRVSDAQALTRCFDEWLRAQGERLKDLLETHGIIEVAIASLAAERRTETDLRAMEAAQVPPDAPRRLMQERHRAFHDALAKAAHNELLRAIEVGVRNEIFIPLDHLLSDELSDRFSSEMHDYHARILDAVRNRDPARAAAEMRRHLVDPHNWGISLAENVRCPDALIR